MEDSLGKRYLIKLISTLLITLINSAVQFVLPRALSVNEYAEYTYNLNIFTSILSIAILSADGAFASKISKRLAEGSLVKFYGKILLSVVALLNVLFICVFCMKLGNEFFQDQTVVTVLLALNASILLKILQEVMTLYDCYALTRLSEPFIVLQKIGIALLVYIFYIFSILNLVSFYVIQIIVVSIVILSLIYIFFHKKKEIFYKEKTISNIEYVKEFVRYCKPLIVANIVTNSILLVSNWLLKNYGGNIEQAFFGVAWQLNALLAYTFTPITVLLQREYAIRVDKMEELSELYKSVLKKTITLVSFFACFIFVNASEVLDVLFGSDYSRAGTITQLIMIYTIFQACGQVNGAMYSATERTKLYAIIAIITQFSSLALIFLFQIPNQLWPNGLGSVGIGLQKTVGNLISVLLCGFYNCKYLRIKFLDEYKAALTPTVILFILAYVIRVIDGGILKKIFEYNNMFIHLFTDGFLYIILVMTVISVCSSVFGLQKEVSKVKGIIRK